MSKELTLHEKIFYVEIDSLDNEKGCFASNGYFSDFFGITKQRCSQIINSLIEKNFLTVSYEINGKEVKKRILRVSNKFDRVSRKVDGGYQENVKGNNTYINNTYTTNSKKTNKPFKPPTLQQISDYIKEKGYMVNPNEFYETYTESNWYDKTGKKIKIWKMVIVSWHRNNLKNNKNSESTLDTIYQKVN
ncbi:MAG: helix-turn-helix domain-containing protein [Thermoplasmatales archaeon]|nr:MAG: helix-turn-helix domain-containing protein [Thermoplasmatales archaeon]